MYLYWLTEVELHKLLSVKGRAQIKQFVPISDTVKRAIALKFKSLLFTLLSNA